jgi:hypothetical protein
MENIPPEKIADIGYISRFSESFDHLNVSGILHYCRSWKDTCSVTVKEAAATCSGFIELSRLSIDPDPSIISFPIPVQ